VHEWTATRADEGVPTAALADAFYIEEPDGQLGFRRAQDVRVLGRHGMPVVDCVALIADARLPG
jgi:hypothetical protein